MQFIYYTSIGRRFCLYVVRCELVSPYKEINDKFFIDAVTQFNYKTRLSELQ
jgi:hypothetical protein